MKRFYPVVALFAAVVAVACVGTAIAGSSVCTPATCVGIVRAYFPYSNCSGTPAFEEINEALDVCSDGSIAKLEAEGLMRLNVRTDNAGCDVTGPNATYDFSYNHFGSCIPNIQKRSVGRLFVGEVSAMSQGYMYLANVNQSYESPQDFDNQPLPPFRDFFATCYSPNNCTLDNGQPAPSWRTYFEHGCDNPAQSLFNPYGSDVCLNYDNLTYVKQGCFEAKGAYTAYFHDSACTKPILVYGTRASCSEPILESVTCNPPITPLPLTNPAPSAPTSSASFFQLSWLFVAIALSAFAYIA
jgi:hypothetical protein